VSSAVKQDKDITKKSVDELSKTLGQKVDKSEENTFSAAYGVEISEEGYGQYYASKAQNELITAPSGAVTDIPSTSETSEDNLAKSVKLEHSGWIVPKDVTGSFFTSGIEGYVKNILSTNLSTDKIGNAVGANNLYFKNLGMNLNGYLEASGGSDSSGYLAELSQKLSDMKGDRENPLLDRVLSLVEQVRSGKYIDVNSDEFMQANEAATEYQHTLKQVGKLDPNFSKAVEETFGNKSILQAQQKITDETTLKMLDSVMDNLEETKARQAADKEKAQKSRTTTTNTDAVDAQIKRLQQEQARLAAQLSSADGTQADNLQRRLAKIEQELSQKNNDTYRRQHAKIS
jgi:hypothetical protein